MAVLVGWVLGLADLATQVGTLEDSLDRVSDLRREYLTDPPEPAWHGKVLLLVHLLMVCRHQPLQLTFVRWHYGCWKRSRRQRAASELTMYIRRRGDCSDIVATNFREYLASLRVEDK